MVSFHAWALWIPSLVAIGAFGLLFSLLFLLLGRIWTCITRFGFFFFSGSFEFLHLGFLFEEFETATASAWSLVLMVPIWTSLYFSYVSDSMKFSRLGICQFRSVNLPKWNVLTKTENSSPKFESIDKINWSSLFSIPRCFNYNTSDLKLVKVS